MSQYAPTMYAPSMYAQPAYSGHPGMPMLPLPNGGGPPPLQNGYSRDYDGASSGENCSDLMSIEYSLTSFINDLMCLI